MRRAVTFVLAVVLLSGCAAKTKPTLAKFDAASLAAVQVIAQTEKDLSAAGALTPAQSLDIRLALRPVIELGDKATAALIVWQPGDKTPEALLTLSARIADLSKTIIAMLPDGAPKAKILAAITLAQAAWEAVIRVMNTGGAA